MKNKILIFPIIIFISVLVIFYYLLLIDRNPSEIPSALLNKKIPKFETNSLLESERFISTNVFGNEKMLVNFFATWCKPCRDEHNYLNRLKKEKKIKIIGINYKDSNKKTINWLSKLGNPYSKIAVDKNGRIAIDWGVYGIPETFIVNSKGVIKYRLVGPINAENYKKIISLIQESK